MSAITAKARRKMKKYAVLTREPRCFLGSFDFSWEQRKLGELAVFNPKEEIPDAFEYVDLESVVGTEMLSHRTEEKATAPSRAQRLAHTGDLFYQTVRPYQKNNYLFEKPDKHYVFSTGYAQLRPFIDGYFLLSLVQNGQFVKTVLDNCTGTSYPAINANDLAEIEVFSPKDEQEHHQIGTYFRNLDNLITLHQRKCALLFSSFQALISLIFTTSTFSWEQRKFGEITSKYEDPVPTPHDGYYRLGIRSHAKGTFHSYVSKGQELETAQMHRVAAGNFIVNITFGWEHAVAITDKNDAGKLVSHRFPQFSFAEGMVPEFFRYVIVDEKFRHHLWLASPGGAGRNRVLKLDEMLNYLMRFPSRDEQIKIAEFFRQLDNLITLHQRKPFLMKWRTSDANRNQTNRLVL